MVPLLTRQATQLGAAREKEIVLAQARLRPDRAEELLAAYQTRTGRLLSKPLPLGTNVPLKEQVAHVFDLRRPRNAELNAR